MPTEEATSNNAKAAIDILLKEFEHRFSEILTYTQRYQKQADYLNLFLTSVLAVAALIFSGKTKEILGQSSTLDVKDLSILYCGFLLFSALFLFHLFASIMDVLVMVRFNGERLAAIEVQINARSGEDLLIWESRAIPYYFAVNQIRIGAWIKPNTLAGIWMFLIFILLCISFCVMAFVFVPMFSYFYVPVVLFMTVFHVYQWMLMLTSGFGSLHSYFQHADQSTVPSRQITAEVLGALIPVLSVIEMIIWSAQHGVLWSDSRVVFPLISVPSIYVGDLIILPIFNFRAATWFKQHARQCRGRVFAKYSAACLLSALLLNIYLHYQWTHDPYSGFIDTTHGRLSAAGWCHFVFSSCEMTFIFLFLVFWVTALVKGNLSGAADGQSVWRFFVAFSSISIADAVVKYRYVFPSWHIAPSANLADLLSLTSFISSGVVLVVLASVLHRRRRIQSFRASIAG
jgi:hypothetical protein